VREKDRQFDLVRFASELATGPQSVVASGSAAPVRASEKDLLASGAIEFHHRPACAPWPRAVAATASSCIPDHARHRRRCIDSRRRFALRRRAAIAIGRVAIAIDRRRARDLISFQAPGRVWKAASLASVQRAAAPLLVVSPAEGSGGSEITG
jgi:hypothetical protein